MQGWPRAQVLHSAEEIKAANYPDIRLFTVKRDIAFQPQNVCVGSWPEYSLKKVPQVGTEKLCEEISLKKINTAI